MHIAIELQHGIFQNISKIMPREDLPPPLNYDNFGP